ncbi:MAG: hypothetical protein FWF88_11015 [Peptococcaceae bacterium]|nr:hypothetical protein [Peptococcaceae bacterium]
MHNCLVKNKLFPQTLAQGGLMGPLAGSIKGTADWPANIVCSVNTVRSAHISRPTNTAWNSHIAWPTWPGNTVYSAAIPTPWPAKTADSLAYSSHALTSTEANRLPPKNAHDGRLTCILIAILILTALDQIFLR